MIERSASSHERRYLYIVFFSFGIILASHLVESLVTGYYERNWENLVDPETSDYLDQASARFGAIQRETRRLTTDLADNVVIKSYLENQSFDLGPVYQELAKAARVYDVGIELFDHQGNLIAWGGISGPVSRDEIQVALGGELVSYVVPSTLYSQLFVATPVRGDNEFIGVILVRNTIDTHYPLTNKYVAQEGLTESVRADMGLSVRYAFGARDTSPGMRGYKSAPLFGFDSSRIGRVLVVPPQLQPFVSRIEDRFRVFHGLLWFVIVGFMIAIAWRRLNLLQHAVLKSLAVTFLIWVTRYILLWLEIPSGFYAEGVFDPAFYASTFGNGLAKSIGELSLTSLALLVNTVLLGRFLMDVPGFKWEAASLAGRILRVVGAFTTTVLFFLFLRGYGAVVQSAVVDSSLLYTDPAVVIPPFELALMVVNLFMISLSLIIVSAGLISLIVFLLSENGGRAGDRIMPWLFAAGFLVVVAMFFGYTRNHPLMTTEYRILFSLGLLLYTYYLQRSTSQEYPVTPGSLLIPLALSALFLYPLLDARSQEKERGRMEVFAKEFLRPVDSWLTFVVDEALESFQSDEVLATIERGVPEEVDRLSLSVWASTSACREGYSSLFFIADPFGRPLSRFRIGDISLLSERGLSRNPPLEKMIQIQEIGAGVNAVKVYRGAVPLSRDGFFLGHAFVLVAAGQQTLFRGDVPAFLRSPSPESLESFHRPITVAEFRDGELFASTDDIFPVGFGLPGDVVDQLGEGTFSFWDMMDIGEDEYETLFVKGNPGVGQVIALCLPAKGTYWHFFNLVKVLVYYVLTILVVLAVYLALRWIRGRPYRASFRDKLLAALLLTAIIPLIVIAFYGREFAEDRLMQETLNRLKLEADAIALQIVQKSDDALNPREQTVEQIANETGADFNFYVGTQLRNTSRPELYEAGLLDRRLSGSAYSALVIEGKRFFQQTENVGRFRYAVGYRPLYNADGNVVAIISVPTIYRQDELDRQVSQQNAFLFGVYAIVFLAIIVVASTVASRIASPIHRLTEATRRVSKGELDVSVGGHSGEGEIGELVRSFETMTRNLKQQRDELVRFERELAWKEMAKQVAHEIKNPLTPMRLSLQHLRQTYRDRVTDFERILDEVVKGVIEQIDSLSRIASEFSRFAQMPKSRREICDLNDIVTESLRLTEQERGLTLEKHLAEADLPIMADKEEVRRAFTNIIRNGIQAMNSAGRMIVTTELSEGEARVIFKDFGTGIPDEIKEKLFQPNFSTKSEGMGLGLAIVKKTIDDLGGTIQIKSRLAEGTEVTVGIKLEGGSEK